MNITVYPMQGRVPVTVLQVEGKLDSNSFQLLIDEAKKVYDGGARDLLLDLSKLTYISSAGIVAVHSVAKLFRGEALPDLTAGWAAIRSAERERTPGVQQHVKLFGVQSEVQNVLDVVGLSAFFESFHELDKALASY